MPTRCTLLTVDSGTNPDSRWNTLSAFYPEDVNRKQTFDLPEQWTTELRLVFEEAQTCLGGVTVYNLELDGLNS